MPQKLQAAMACVGKTKVHIQDARMDQILGKQIQRTDLALGEDFLMIKKRGEMVKRWRNQPLWKHR